MGMTAHIVVPAYDAGAATQSPEMIHIEVIGFAAVTIWPWRRRSEAVARRFVMWSCLQGTVAKWRRRAVSPSAMEGRGRFPHRVPLMNQLRRAETLAEATAAHG
jgi:hypothetical protein